MRWLGIGIFPIVVLGALGVTLLQLRASVLSSDATDRVRQLRDELRIASGRAPLSSPQRKNSDRGARADMLSRAPRDNSQTADPNATGPRSLERESRETMALAGRVREILFADTSALSSYASLLRNMAELQPTVEGQVPLYCEALVTLAQSMHKEPRNARLLMQWGNIRQILGAVDCGQPETSGDFKAAITRALELDPTNADAQYAAGQILRWANANVEATHLFNQVLRYQPRLSPLQEKQIYSFITNAETLKAVVPPRFPQILGISRYLGERPVRFGDDREAQRSFRATLERLQLEAVEASSAEYAEDAIPYTMHLDRLISLTDVAASSAVRQVLDQKLSTLLGRRGDVALAHYLAERTKWDELELVPTTIAGDTRPLRSPLVSWGTLDSFFADEFYRTLGFFLADGQGVHAIELAFSERPSEVFLDALRVYVSSDNQNWNEVALAEEPRAFSLGSRYLVVLRVAGRADRYWKVHFSNAARERTLLGNVHSIQHVYGLSSRSVASKRIELEADSHARSTQRGKP